MSRPGLTVAMWVMDDVDGFVILVDNKSKQMKSFCKITRRQFRALPHLIEQITKSRKRENQSNRLLKTLKVMRQSISCSKL